MFIKLSDTKLNQKNHNITARLAVYGDLLFENCFLWRENFPAIISQINEAIDLYGQKKSEECKRKCRTCAYILLIIYKTLVHTDYTCLIENLEIFVT